jgi:quinol monooxygenase YgiN
MVNAVGSVEFVRIYRLQPAEGKAEQLAAALAELADVIGAFAGSQRREMYRDRADGSYVFAETWLSEEAYAAASNELPREVFTPIMAAIEGPPQVVTLDRLTFEGRA